jgi:hypothetical protein
MKLFIVFLILVCALIFVQVSATIAIGTALTMFWDGRIVSLAASALPAPLRQRKHLLAMRIGCCRLP